MLRFLALVYNTRGCLEWQNHLEILHYLKSQLGGLQRDHNSSLYLSSLPILGGASNGKSLQERSSVSNAFMKGEHQALG